MEQEKKQAVALMRYSAIAPLITGTQEDYESLSAYFRTISAKGIKASDGSLRHYSPGTLEKWYLSYRKSGFAKQRITLRYTPDMKDIFIMEADGSLTPIRLLNKHDNASVKRDKVRLTGGED